MSRLRKLSVASVVATVALIAVGAIVRASGSGLGCPDWPKCHGRWVPPLEASALIEYSHRLSASVVGALVLALAIYAWVRFRSLPGVFWPSFGALVVVVFQGALGRLVVERELEGRLVVAHFATSLALLGLLTLAAVSSFHSRGGRRTPLATEAMVLAGAVFAVALVGAFVVQWNASLPYPDWPLMNGGVAPGAGRAAGVHWLHRAAALLLGAVVVRVAVRAMRQPDRALVRFAHAALALWILQVVVGAVNVLARLPGWAVVVHVVTGTLLWAASVGLAAAAWRRAPREPDAGGAPGREAAATVKAYFLLTKPRIIELLLITTVPAMVAAEGGWPPAALVLATLLGGSLAAGAANAINCYLDRDIDGRMERTSGRPIPAHQVEPVKALRFGILLGAVSFAFLAWTVNLLAALLALSAILFYVFVYTVWLKRSTPSNIVIGGAAGAVPVLVGWAAVRGSLDVAPWLLFAVIFFWTPPHFWALALRYRQDYEAAGVPMLPVVRGVAQTTRQILLYAVALLGVTLLYYPLGHAGVLYLGAAAILGALFVVQGLRLRRAPDERRAINLFHFSIAYLTTLFATVAVDVLAGAPRIAALDAPAFGAGVTLFFAAEAGILLSVVRDRPEASLSKNVRKTHGFG